jgi:alanyl-tRNA synthetase
MLRFRRCDDVDCICIVCEGYNSSDTSGSSGSLSSLSVDHVRDIFLNYFQEKGHSFIPSSSVRPNNDPSLLFTNSGMNQFKSIFLGTEPIQYATACNSQKCIRAGGKHNDLQDVGKDIYHHTFFEMLGNWSFNDYWKPKAIDYAWDLLVNVYQLDPTRIYVTYFKGNNNIPMDTESRDIWKKYLPESRILPFDKENFWEMAESGPCGVCTEIHYDRSQSVRDASSLVNQDDASVLEIWNLVFVEYNHTIDDGGLDGGAINKFEKLPKRFVDTGMGLERLVSILQNTSSNYDTDVFRKLFKTLEEKCKLTYTGKVGEDDFGEKDTAFRIIVDHIRTVCICLSDDIVPGHQQCNSVLRQIIRRAIRYGKSCLGLDKPFFYELVDTFIDSHAYWNIFSKREMIKYIIYTEETQYTATLKSSYRILYKLFKTKTTFTMEDIQNFWNTHGLPVETVIYEIKKNGGTIMQ